MGEERESDWEGEEKEGDDVAKLFNQKKKKIFFFGELFD